MGRKINYQWSGIEMNYSKNRANMYNINELLMINRNALTGSNKIKVPIHELS